LKTVSFKILFLIQFVLLSQALGDEFSPLSGDQVTGITQKMSLAYAQVKDYQTATVVKEYHEGEVTQTDRFIYTFKKPNHIRIDMQSPHPGMILVYPGEHGKVAVKPGGWAWFLKFHLSPDSSLLRITAGQRIDQTDMGLLIQNINHSLTDRRRGETRLSEKENSIITEVLAEDHFLAGVVTLYQFFIDKKRWLPVEIREFTPSRILKREVKFQNLRISIGVPDDFFKINGENQKHGQPG
jgi:outer membrane lipoprotein-sorting protein